MAGLNLADFYGNGNARIPVEHFTPKVQETILKAQIGGQDVKSAAFETLKMEFPDIYNKPVDNSQNNLFNNSQPAFGGNVMPQQPSDVVTVNKDEYEAMRRKSELFSDQGEISKFMNSLTGNSGSAQQVPNTNTNSQQNDERVKDDLFDSLFNDSANVKSNTSQSMTPNYSQNQNTQQQHGVATESINSMNFARELAEASLKDGLDPRDVIKFAGTLDAQSLIEIYKGVQSALNAVNSNNQTNAQNQPQQQQQQSNPLPINLVNSTSPQHVSVGYNNQARVQGPTILD